MIHQPSNLYGSYEIGEGTTVGAFCDIGGKIGKNCKIQTHVSIPPHVVIEDEVFIGPGVRFANDRWMDEGRQPTLVKRGAKVGMGALIRAGVVIGEEAIIGMGAVVLHDVPAGEVWGGNPAKKIK
jgi:UDP-2-acetamido-3-amino-2,3-dideoxy-glucuronate N-acetyltransferase